jgi:hypothetical protein
MPLVLDGTNGVSGVDGTASNPAIEGTDSNTGIFYPAADTVAIGTGGTEALRVNSSQNVGIGTSSPTAASSRRGLVLRGNANGAELIVQSTSATDGTSDGFSLTTVGTDAYLFNRLNGFTAFATNNTERMRLDASGRLLIGDTTSRSNLAIGQAQVQIASASFSTFSMFGNANNTDGSYIALSKARGGTLGGTTAVQSGDILGGIFFEGYNGTGFATAAQIYTKVDGTVSGSQMPGRLEFYTTPTGSNSAVERARITSTGELLVGAAGMGNIYGARLSVEGTSGGSTASEFRVLGSALSTAATYFIKADNNTTTSNVFCKFVINSGGAASGQINANGASAAAFGSWSDERLKENIVDLPPQLSNICALRPVEFDYIESEGGGHQIGFVAQQMEAIYPDVIGEREDGMKSITGWSKTEARLVKAIQELKAIVDAQAAEIAALKAQP